MTGLAAALPAQTPVLVNGPGRSSESDRFPTNAKFAQSIQESHTSDHTLRGQDRVGHAAVDDFPPNPLFLRVSNAEGPKKPVVVDGRDGKQIYPPKNPPDTKSEVRQPDPPEVKPKNGRAAICETIFAHDAKKCRKLAFAPLIGGCVLWAAAKYAFCRLGEAGAGE